MVKEKESKKIIVLSAHTPSLFWFRMDMMANFNACGYKVVAAGNENEAKWSQKFAGNGIKYRQIVVSRNGTNPINDLKTLRSVKKLFKEEKPTKVFLYNAKAVIYGGITASKLHIEYYPLIAGLGSIFLTAGLKNKILKAILCWDYKKALKKSKYVFFQNRDDSDFFVSRKIVKQEKIVYIHGSGVNLEKFKQEPLPLENAFLFIGRLIKDKGVCEYLEACRFIKNKYRDVRCYLVGPFDSNPSALRREELQKYIDEGVIEYFGEQEDVRPYLKKCRVFLLPSYREGTPKAILEAMATGRAIITTDAPGCKETVTDGLNGYLVPIKNVAALVEKMSALIEDASIAERFGQESRRLAEEKFAVNLVNETICKTMNL